MDVILSRRSWRSFYFSDGLASSIALARFGSLIMVKISAKILGEVLKVNHTGLSQSISTFWRVIVDAVLRRLLRLHCHLNWVNLSRTIISRIIGGIALLYERFLVYISGMSSISETVLSLRESAVCSGRSGLHSSSSAAFSSRFAGSFNYFDFLIDHVLKCIWDLLTKVHTVEIVRKKNLGNVF